MSERRRGRVRMVAPELGRIDPGQKPSVERQVYHLLRRAMMSGIIRSGTSLSGRSIAESLGTSPQPIRDALKRLEADGVIESRNKSAYFVIAPTRRQYLDIQQLRLLVEGDAVATAARNATAADADRIEEIHGVYRRVGDFAESYRVNFTFHFAVYRLARSQLLLDVIENLMMRCGPLLHLLSHKYSLGEVAQNHEGIVEALRRRDPAAAQRALRRDLSQAMPVIAPPLAPAAGEDAAGHPGPPPP